MFNLRTGIETYAFDPGNPKRIYAGNAALWRSDDAGRTWRMVFPNPAKKTVEHRNGDHADYSLTSSDGNYITGLSIRRAGYGAMAAIKARATPFAQRRRRRRI